MTPGRIHAAGVLGLAPTLVVGLCCLRRPDLTKDLWPLMTGLAALATRVLTLGIVRAGVAPPPDTNPRPLLRVFRERAPPR